MKKYIKEEALEQVNNDVLMGFDNKEEIFENTMDLFYDVDDFDEDWLTSIIEKNFKKQEKASLSWKNPSDFDRLVLVFDQLIAAKIVCLHKAGYTIKDGMEDCREVVSDLKRKGIEAVGYCFYHTQDLERAIDAEQRNLPLSFGSVTASDAICLEVGKQITDLLSQQGFSFLWSGSVEDRIVITNIDWQKLPTNENYGKQRNLLILKTLENG